MAALGGLWTSCYLGAFRLDHHLSGEILSCADLLAQEPSTWGVKQQCLHFQPTRLEQWLWRLSASLQVETSIPSIPVEIFALKRCAGLVNFSPKVLVFTQRQSAVIYIIEFVINTCFWWLGWPQFVLLLNNPLHAHYCRLQAQCIQQNTVHSRQKYNHSPVHQIEKYP